MTPCTGQPGHSQCSTCARHALRAILRPVVKLTDCRLHEPATKRERIDLVPYAGKDAR